MNWTSRKQEISIDFLLQTTEIEIYNCQHGRKLISIPIWILDYDSYHYHI